MSKNKLLYSMLAFSLIAGSFNSVFAQDINALVPQISPSEETHQSASSVSDLQIINDVQGNSAQQSSSDVVQVRDVKPLFQSPVMVEPVVKEPPKPLETGIARSQTPVEKLRGLLTDSWNTIKGKPARNSVSIGMYSYHTSSKRKTMNQKNNLVGVEYKGIAAGTFNNSYRKQSYFIGVARKIYTKQFTKDISMDLKYRLGLVYGYGDKYPNLAGISPLILPMVGTNYKRYGLDLIVIPSKTPVFAGSFRIGF